ncbi:MAG: peroxiredoxin family protein [Salibacteraceae bacterium]
MMNTWIKKALPVTTALAIMLLIGGWTPKTPQGIVGIKVGNMAPDIELKNPAGESIKLSELRGKMVLLDFWASWCGPCRRENPNVVNAYKEFHEANFKNADGFEIFSVSLDRQKAPWLQAIKQDNLSWPAHVWDNQQMASRAYEVRGIPYSFLIDANGIILAKNLRGPSLHATLAKHLSEG